LIASSGELPQSERRRIPTSWYVHIAPTLTRSSQVQESTGGGRGSRRGNQNQENWNKTAKIQERHNIPGRLAWLRGTLGCDYGFQSFLLALLCVLANAIRLIRVRIRRWLLSFDGCLSSVHFVLPGFVRIALIARSRLWRSVFLPDEGQ
jgi:hypothetical protein